jgi:hypothetical protein
MIAKSHELGVAPRRWRVQDMLRIVWVHPVPRMGWEDDDWSVWEAARDGNQQERL